MNLHIYLLFYLPACISTYLSTCLPTYWSCLSAYLLIYLSTVPAYPPITVQHLSAYFLHLSTFQSAWLYTSHLPIPVYVYLPTYLPASRPAYPLSYLQYLPVCLPVYLTNCLYLSAYSLFCVICTYLSCHLPTCLPVCFLCTNSFCLPLSIFPYHRPCRQPSITYSLQNWSNNHILFSIT